MYASAEKIMATPKVIGIPSDLEHLIHTFICTHSFAKYCPFMVLFQGLEKGKIIETSKKKTVIPCCVL